MDKSKAAISLLNNKHVSESRKIKWLKKSFRKVCEKRYKGRFDKKKVEQYEMIRGYYINLNIITEEEVMEIEKEIEGKYRK